MFRPMLHVLALRKLGLTRPFRYLIAVVFLGCLAAGLIYAFAIFHALTERSHVPYVQPNTSR